VFLSGVLEYICADLLQAAGNRCIASKKGDVIGLTDVVQTMTEDEELSKLFFVVSSVSVALSSSSSSSSSSWPKIPTFYFVVPCRNLTICL
jgi:hypothetical protein